VNVQQLAQYLAGLPAEYQDQPVVVNGWGSSEGTCYEVTGAFRDREGVGLGHGGIDWQTHEPQEWYMRGARLEVTPTT
jgi:hypothetical protein